MVQDRGGGSSSGKNGSKPGSLQEAMFLRKLAATPTSRLLSRAELPAIPAPSLEGLTLKVPAQPQVTADDVYARFDELCIEAAPRRRRERDELLMPGDEVVVDVAGYIAGQLLPHSVQQGLKLLLIPGEFLPGFSEALAGHPVSGKLTVRVLMPAEHPILELRGKTVVYAVSVVGAWEVEEYDPESPAFLAKLGRGSTLDGVMQSIAQELAELRAAEARLELADQALEQLVARSSPQVPDAVVDREIGRVWQLREGGYLEEIGAAPEEKEAALALWLDDPSLRAEYKQRLAGLQVIRAIVEKEKQSLSVGPAQIDALLDGVAKGSGFSAEELRVGMREEPERARQLVDQAFIYEVLDFVIARAQVVPA